MFKLNVQQSKIGERDAQHGERGLQSHSVNLETEHQVCKQFLGYGCIEKSSWPVYVCWTMIVTILSLPSFNRKILSATVLSGLPK